MVQRYLYITLVLSFFNIFLASTSHAAKTKVPAEPVFFNSIAQEGVNSGAMYLKSKNEEIRMLLDYVGGRMEAQIYRETAVVGAIGDAAEAKAARANANKATIDVKKYLKDNKVDISAQLKQSLAKEVFSIKWLPAVKTVDVEKKFPSFATLQKKHHIEDDVYSKILIDYYFSPHFETFNVVVRLDAYKTMRSIYRQHDALGDNDKKKRKELFEKYSGKLKKPYYKSQISYSSEKLAPMTLEKRSMTKEEKVAEKLRIEAMFEDVIAEAKNRKQRDKYKRRKKGALGNVRKAKTFVDSENRNGKLWLENDGEKLKSVIAESVAEIAELLRQDLDGTASHRFKLEDKDRTVFVVVDRWKRRNITATQKPMTVD